jgi:hypothetical protein
VANRLQTATEVWQPEARRCQELDYRVLHSKEQPEIHYPSGGRYMVQAGNINAGVGFTVDRAMVDEAWRVPMESVTQALSPAMSARPNTQLWIISTAGDSESALLRHYRAVGLDPESDVCLIEWAAPAGADWLDESEWANCTPHFDQQRLAFMRQQAGLIPEPVFRSQYLNQWVHSAEGWMPPSLWTEGEDKAHPMPEPTVVAVEQDLDGTNHHLVEAGLDAAGRVVVRYGAARTFAEVDIYMATRRRAVLMAPPVYAGRLRTEFTFVGRREIDASMRTVMGLVSSSQLRHDGDERLSQSVLSAQQHIGRDGAQTLVRTPGVSLAPARAFLWAAWTASARQAQRPKIYVAKQ